MHTASRRPEAEGEGDTGGDRGKYGCQDHHMDGLVLRGMRRACAGAEIRR